MFVVTNFITDALSRYRMQRLEAAYACLKSLEKINYHKKTEAEERTTCTKSGNFANYMYCY